jgi:TCP-1/cpn60 chaperonin family
MLRDAAERTGDAVGDGTTTSTLLAHAIVSEGVRNIASGPALSFSSVGSIGRHASQSKPCAGSHGPFRATARSGRSQPSRLTTLRSSASSSRGPSREELRRQIVDTISDYDREKLEERLAKLSGVAVIRLGAPSEAEMKSRHEAVDDAIHATRAAIAEGVVPGAGLALLRVVPAVEAEASRVEGDERAGAQILRRALEAPARQIAENSGVDGGVVVERMHTGTGIIGFDAASGKYVDLIEAGIIDPIKVVRLALENAVSVAGVLLLTEQCGHSTQLLGYLDPVPSSYLTVDKTDRPVVRVALPEVSAHGRCNLLGRPMAGGAHRPLGNRPQHTDSGAKVDGETVDLTRSPAGVGPNERCSPRPWYIRWIAQAVAGSARGNPLPPFEMPDRPHHVGVAGLYGECRAALVERLCKLSQQCILQRHDDEIGA